MLITGLCLFGFPVGVSELISIQSTRRYYTDSLYGSTRRYDWTYTYITELILIFFDTRVPVGTTKITQIQEYP